MVGPAAGALAAAADGADFLTAFFLATALAFFAGAFAFAFAFFAGALAFFAGTVVFLTAFIFFAGALAFFAATFFFAGAAFPLPFSMALHHFLHLFGKRR
jgi:hypothetical protein